VFEHESKYEILEDSLCAQHWHCDQSEWNVITFLSSHKSNATSYSFCPQLYRVNNNKGQGQPSRIERDYINPMRILSLSMPPDAAEDMREAQFNFEKAAAGLSKITTGVRRDLPVEIGPTAQKDALEKWEEGRVALNSFFAALNDTTGLNELKPVPAAGPNQNKEYGRSEKRYFELMKKTKLCQNRGGPALSQAWGQLMVSGYLQDSCGIPDMDTYFYQ